MGRWLPLCLALFIASGAATARVEPEQFVAWMRESYHTPNSLPAELRTRARTFRYVFVSGFLNEVLGSKVSDCMRALTALGVPPSRIHKLRPSSLVSVEENAGYVRDFLRTTASRGTEKLVVIAHSKGAAETLAALAGAGPELHERIQAVFFVHGAFGGSPIADYFYGEGVDVDEKMPFALRTAFQWIKAATGKEKIAYAQKLLGVAFDGGLASLTKRRMEYLWERVLATSRPAIEALADRMYFIRGRETTDRVRRLLWATSVYLSAYHGDNDGALSTAGQTLAAIGTPFAQLRSDHTMLLGSYGGAANKALRRAFVDAVAAAAASDWSASRK